MQTCTHVFSIEQEAIHQAFWNANYNVHDMHTGHVQNRKYYTNQNEYNTSLYSRTVYLHYHMNPQSDGGHYVN